jgi:hypothetical protein
MAVLHHPDTLEDLLPLQHCGLVDTRRGNNSSSNHRSTRLTQDRRHLLKDR